MIWITTVFAVFLAKEYDKYLVQFKTQWLQETNTGWHPVWMGDNWEVLHRENAKSREGYQLLSPRIEVCLCIS